MAKHDEPLFDSNEIAEPAGDEVADLPARIRRLVQGQPYAVLCTQGREQPYGSLVAFAFTSDLKRAVLATPVATRKFRLLSECPQMALVIDDRPDRGGDVMAIEAVTATGRAALVDDEESAEPWVELLLERHRHLAAFVASPSCAIFRIDVVRFFHVARFQEVGQWIP